jgi:hypothetical protein
MKRLKKITVAFAILLLWSLGLFFYSPKINDIPVESKIEELQKNQKKSFKKNKIVILNNEYFHYNKVRGFNSYFDENKEYSIIGYYKRHGINSVFVKDNNRIKKIDFKDLRIQKELFPEEDFFIKIDTNSINNSVDQEGNKIIDTFITASKYYPAIQKDSLNLLFIDNKGNQITMRQNLITKKIIIMGKLYIAIHVLQGFFMFWGVISYLSNETSLTTSILSIFFTFLIIAVLYFTNENDISNKKIAYLSYLILLGIIGQIWFVIKYYKTKSLTNTS